MRNPIRSIELGGVCNLAVLAPIKAGFVPGFESITYLERLRKLLKALHAARQNLRESELRNAAFPDSIGRFGIIHSFRYHIVPPRTQAGDLDEPGTSLLSLNVTFDGGWEPYMRVIYRDLGPLLDALFCHCDGYPGSHDSFDAYCRWVRENELDGGLFFTEATVTLADQRYLAEVERLQRETPHPERADEAIARFAIAPEVRQTRLAIDAALKNPLVALALPVRTLKGLYRLLPYFPDNRPGDGRVLLRFAQSLLQEFREIVPALASAPAWAPLQDVLADELAWITRPEPGSAPPEGAVRKRPLAYKRAALQAMMLSTDPVTHGCVVLLGVADADAAVAFLQTFAGRCGTPDGAAQVRCHVALTYAGLQELGVAADRLDALPPEFAEGMEARCGLLGDVRSNHPDHWRRPQRDRATRADERVDLSGVHVVIVLRLIDPTHHAPDLHPTLETEVEALRAGKAALTVLAVQPMRSSRGPDGSVREHFGFVDGISQPKIVPRGVPKAQSGEVRPGELLLGFANDRGDLPYPAQEDLLLDNGSFLVLRKLRQHVDRLEAALGAHPVKDEVLAKMMGRSQDGTPLAARQPGGDLNDFDYEADPAGEACPFHAHIRRANPRDGRQAMPRILRRGMSYGPRTTEAGPQAERGVVFMAYCASIAEQFETIQRWIAGGNSSGVSSSQADPFLAVPRPGEKRTFRYIDGAGKVARVDLREQPFVQLEWGLYLFVPSLAALKGLAKLREPPQAAPKDSPPEPPEPDESIWTWRRRLEDPDRSESVWRNVREQYGGRRETAYGTLLGTADQVLDVLRDGGSGFSVQGYGTRMTKSLGLNHLGIDHRLDEVAAKRADVVNGAIEDIGEEAAFKAALPLVVKTLAGFRLLAQLHPDGRPRVPVDLVTLSERVLAGLCTAWLGLPEDRQRVPREQAFMVPGGRVAAPEGAPRCPGQMFGSSSYIFSPHPEPEVEEAGKREGPQVHAAVLAFVRSARQRGKLAEAIETGLKALGADEAYIASAIAGVLLGFPPTVHGNFLKTMDSLIEPKKERKGEPRPDIRRRRWTLWSLQQRLAAQTDEDDYPRAEKALRTPLLDTMRLRPVPEVLWRCPVVDDKAGEAAVEPFVLGIASALTDPDAPHELMFGGARCDRTQLKTRGALETPHACPGYGMGIGVLLALIAGLLDAGTLRPTGSPVLLMLTPRAS